MSQFNHQRIVFIAASNERRMIAWSSTTGIFSQECCNSDGYGIASSYDCISGDNLVPQQCRRYASKPNVKPYHYSSKQNIFAFSIILLHGATASDAMVLTLLSRNMMPSSNGNISRVTALCTGNSPVNGEFPAQRPVTRGFDVFFDLRLIKRLSKQSPGWWFETPSRSLWRHRIDVLVSKREGLRHEIVGALRVCCEYLTICDWQKA